MQLITFANAFTLLMGIAAYVGTHYVLKWMDEAQTPQSETARVVVFCLGAIAMICVTAFAVGTDWRLAAVPGASFLCCLARSSRRGYSSSTDSDAFRKSLVSEWSAKTSIAMLDKLPPGTAFSFDLQDYRKTASVRGDGPAREVLCHPVIGGLMQPGVECWLPAISLVDA